MGIFAPMDLTPLDYAHRQDDDPFQDINDQNFLTYLWRDPRLFFQYVHVRHVDKYVYVLLFLLGVGRALDRAVDKNTGDGQSLIFVLVICFVVGGLFGWIVYYFYAALVGYLSRQFLGGTATTWSLLRVLTFAGIPSVLTLIPFAVQLALVGEGMFETSGTVVGLGFPLETLFWVTYVAELLLIGWSIYLMITAVSVVQEFSKKRAIVSLLGPMILLVILILALIFGIRIGESLIN